MPDRDEFICIYDAAQRLGCSRRTILRLVRRKTLYGEPLPGGRKIWMRRAEVDALVNRLAERHRRQVQAHAALRQMWLDL